MATAEWPYLGEGNMVLGTGSKWDHSEVRVSNIQTRPNSFMEVPSEEGERPPKRRMRWPMTAVACPIRGEGTLVLGIRELPFVVEVDGVEREMEESDLEASVSSSTGVSTIVGTEGSREVSPEEADLALMAK